MGRFPIVPSGAEAGIPKPSDSGGRPLPTFYMGDFSVLGLRVGRWEDAVRLLEDHAFAVRRSDGGAELDLDGPGQLRRAVELLGSRGIAWEVADLAGGIYQG